MSITVRRFVEADAAEVSALITKTLRITNSKGDALIPYFFTYDRRLQDVRKCYCLQALAINAKNHAVIPVYTFDGDVLDFVKEHCTFEKHQERKQKMPNVELLIDKCEKALTKLIDNEAQHPLP